MAMAEGSVSSSTSKKSVPPLVSELLDLAIFSFACQSGLRSHHKIRGDPVVEGVAAFFGRLISCSNPETLVEFDTFSKARLGNWEPRSEPTKELRTLISSRLKTAKSNGAIRDERQPSVPSILHDKEQSFCEAEDRVKTKFFPKCWRCSRRCAFCIAKKRSFPNFGNFNTDIAWPFLDLLEELLEEEEDDHDSEHDSDIQGAESDINELGDDDENDKMLRRCLSETSLPESDGEQKPDDEDKGDDGNDEVESDQEMDEDPFNDGYY